MPSTVTKLSTEDVKEAIAYWCNNKCPSLDQSERRRVTIIEPTRVASYSPTDHGTGVTAVFE